MSNLTKTIARKLREEEKQILEELKNKEECYCLITLSYEEGEVLITLLMSDEEIQKSSEDAVKEVFKGKTAINVFISRSREIISFTII